MTPNAPLEIKKLLHPMMAATWWPDAFRAFRDVLLAEPRGRLLVLYNADADGFAASYFIFKITKTWSSLKDTVVLTRPVWNYEFDFQWLPEFVHSEKPDAIVCVDIPIIQESVLLREIAVQCRIAIYDHHDVSGVDVAIPGVLYLNSLLLDSKRADHPPSMFAAAASAELTQWLPAECLILAMGLMGDRALHRYSELAEFLRQSFPDLLSSTDDWNSPLARMKSQINVLFRAKPGETPVGIHDSLKQFLTSNPPVEAMRLFARTYSIAEAELSVKNDVSAAIDKLIAGGKAGITNGVCCQVVEMKTFSVGIVASVLAAKRFAAIMALAYPAGDRLQFELRTSDDSKINLADLLLKQRKLFRPITSGGHPKAAGALINRSDLGNFRTSLLAVAARIRDGIAEN